MLNGSTKPRRTTKADYQSAVALHRRRKAPLPDIVCYHCQQCVEKYLKVYLIAQGSTPLRSHDLEDLLNLCALYYATLTARLPLVHVLNPYGVLIFHMEEACDAPLDIISVPWSAMAKLHAWHSMCGWAGAVGRLAS